MQASNRLDGIGEYYFSQKLREIEALNQQGRNVINLGIGSPDLPPHPDVIDVLQKESSKQNVHAYQGYKGSPVLRKAIAEWYKTWYGVQLDVDGEILPLIGSKEGIMHVCMAFINPGDAVLVPNPGYPTYRSAVKLSGGHCIDYTLRQENDWEPDLTEIEVLVRTHNVRLMFVNFPHMPTGKVASPELMQQLVDFARRTGVLLCHDNPYSFILTEKPASLLSVKGAKDVVIELNSLSKSHNMAGWRVGMLCGSSTLVNEVLRFKSNMDSGMFLPIQLAAARALQLGQDWHDSVNEVYRSRRETASRLLREIGCALSNDQSGMFLWASIPDTYANGFEMSDDILNKAAVFITPGGIFGTAGDAYLRISLCSPESRIQESIERIHHAFAQQATLVKER